MIDYANVFYLSYWRSTQKAIDGVPFLDAFYKNFLASSPAIAQRFEHTSFDALIRMLSISIVHVAKYYQTRQPDPLLKILAARHSQADLDIKPEWYEHWVAALVKTVAIYDPEFDDTTRESWRRVFAPGVEYMQSRYAGEPQDGSADEPGPQAGRPGSRHVGKHATWNVVCGVSSRRTTVRCREVDHDTEGIPRRLHHAVDRARCGLCLLGV